MKIYYVNAQGKKEVQEILNLKCQILAMYPGSLLIGCTKNQYLSILNLSSNYHWRVHENRLPVSA